MSTDIFREMVLSVSERLGFDSNVEDALTSSDVYMIYDICRFEKVKVCCNT